MDAGDSNNWITFNDLDCVSNLKLYCTSLYFTLTAITTVGYGDITTTNGLERVVCTVLMFVGVSYYLFTQG